MSKRNSRQAKALRRAERTIIPPEARQRVIFAAIRDAIEIVASNEDNKGNCVLYAHVGAAVLTKVTGHAYDVTGGWQHGRNIRAGKDRTSWHAWCTARGTNIFADFTRYETMTIARRLGLVSTHFTNEADYFWRPLTGWTVENYTPSGDVTAAVKAMGEDMAQDVEKATRIALENLGESA